MILITKLLLAHFVGDFILQPNYWVKDKEKKKAQSKYLYLHILIHAILLSIILWDVSLWKLILGITVSHFIIDVLKLYQQKKKNKPKWFIIDQILHIISILMIGYVFENSHFELNSIVENTHLWVLLTSILFLTSVSGIIIQNLMHNWSESIESNKDDSLANAGKYIGILERLFIFVFILTQHFEAIGFLLAAKSIFRFGDLTESKDRKLTEYILIGTLLSFGIAILTGLWVERYL